MHFITLRNFPGASRNSYELLGKSGLNNALLGLKAPLLPPAPSSLTGPPTHTAQQSIEASEGCFSPLLRPPKSSWKFLGTPTLEKPAK